jgi:diketogulonate reductase-like aldo/keto reductase
MPQIGLGVFQVDPATTQSVVEAALEMGYRHVDTAPAYVNEAPVGAAIRAVGLPREELFVTSKLRNGDQGRAQARVAYEDSCERLGLDYLDLYLIHWPNPAAGLWLESWETLTELHAEGQARAVGVSNFLVEHLEELESAGLPLPHVNQVELHPSYQRADIVVWCQARGVRVEAYSPLAQGADLQLPEIHLIAERVGASPAAVILRWLVEREFVVIPKSVNPLRMRSNADLEDVRLSPDDLRVIDGLESGNRCGGDPLTFSLSQIR